MKREDIPGEYLDFLKRFTGDEPDIRKLAGDASNRVYYRVNTGKEGYLLCHDESYASLNDRSYPFLIIHSLFKEKGIPVPGIYARDPERGLLLLEDLGDGLLQYLVPELDPPGIREKYERILDLLIKLQGIKGVGDIPFELSFDIEKLMYELEFFITNTLSGYMGLSLSATIRKELLSEFKKISCLLYRPEYFVLNHRDFHSRNIILFRDDIYFIDFQDARMGLPQYDLVSLLRDSYAVLDRGEVEYLKDYYYGKSRSAGINKMDREEFDLLFDLSAFQRNVKALGSFGFHAHVNGKEFYAGFIPPTLNYLDETMVRRDELKAAGMILKEVIPSHYYHN